MQVQPRRSASLALSVHLDEPGGASWYATGECYDSLGELRRTLGRCSEIDKAVRLVHAWLQQVVGDADPGLA